MEFPAITLLGWGVALWLQAQPVAPPDAVIVRLMPPPSDLETLADILLNTLGLSGAIAAMGILLGITIGGAVFWVHRYRSA